MELLVACNCDMLLNLLIYYMFYSLHVNFSSLSGWLEGQGIQFTVVLTPAYFHSKSRRFPCRIVFGSSTYCLYAFVTSILAALKSSLICNCYKSNSRPLEQLPEENLLDQFRYKKI